MTVSYTINESDYLTHQLYNASHSERINKKRQRSRIFVLVIYLILAAFFYYKDKLGLTVTFGVLAVGMYFYYPIIERRRYRKHYEAYIKEHFKEGVDRDVTLELTTEYLLGRESDNESKIMTKEVKRISELKEVFLIQLTQGQTLIVPKRDLTNVDALRNMLQEIAETVKAPFIDDSNWKWA